MTRSMVFTNTSNWDGEDYELVSTSGDGGRVQKTVLRPGESATLYPEATDTIVFTPLESKDPSPFMMNGRQMIPQQDGSFR